MPRASLAWTGVRGGGTTARGSNVKEFCVVRVLRRLRRYGRQLAVRSLLLALLLAITLAFPRAQAASIKGEVSAGMENGFARLVFTLTEDIESKVRVANSIIIISFQKPVDINVDKLDTSLPGYIGAARRDPDGRGVRIALSRKVTVNSMAAAERLFVDLLPDTWTGLAPGLPREVIDELARRARDAEKKVRAQRALARQAKLQPLRVRVISQPTFTRYVFDLPELTGVAANNAKDRLTLTFDALLKLDLADAKAALPAAISAIDSEIEQELVLVRFTFAEKVDVRTFREDLSFVVDVTPMEAKGTRSENSVRSDELSAFAAHLAATKTAPPEGVDAPPTMPAPAAPAAAPKAAAPPPKPAPAAVPKADAAHARAARAGERDASGQGPVAAARDLAARAGGGHGPRHRAAARRATACRRSASA